MTVQSCVQAHGAIALLLAGPLGVYLQSVVVGAVLDSVPPDVCVSKARSPLGENRLVLCEAAAGNRMVCWLYTSCSALLAGSSACDAPAIPCLCDARLARQRPAPCQAYTVGSSGATAQ